MSGFQGILLKYCVMLDTNNQSSSFNFSGNRGKVTPNVKKSKNFFCHGVLCGRRLTPNTGLAGHRGVKLKWQLHCWKNLLSEINVTKTTQNLEHGKQKTKLGSRN